MRRYLYMAAGALAVVLLAGAVVYFGGFYNVAASQPHNSIVRAVLDFGMRRSVAAHAGNPDTPSLDDPALWVRGARHFDASCAPCHGAPGVRPTPAALAMLPPPPDLSDKVSRFSDDELFWLIRHGLKYTGMPGWPVQGRADEVWSMVAFVRMLPTLDAEGYAAIIETPQSDGFVPPSFEPATAAVALDRCVGCHGPEGQGDPSGAFPRLAGLSQTYIADQLEAFAIGARPSAIMQTAVFDLDEAERQAVAAYFAGQSPASDAPLDDRRPVVEDGGLIAARGMEERDIPPCTACHDIPAATAPDLAGQYPAYIAQQLRLFRSGVRPSSVMNSIAGRLRDREIAALAAFYGTLQP